jgi:hypothetical protein
MILKDGLYKFSLYPGCEAVYIDKEGFTSTRLDDGTIIKIPNYVYHPLSLFTLPVTPTGYAEHPSRDFKFSSKNVVKVPLSIMDRVLVENVERSKECIAALKKKAHKLLGTSAVRLGNGGVFFRFKGVPIKAYRIHWKKMTSFCYYCDFDKQWRLSDMERKRDIWCLGDRGAVDRMYSELEDTIDYALDKKDIPVIFSDLLKFTEV